jgi:DHA1 family tetracycline resistance protein-like MFS transporter
MIFTSSKQTRAGNFLVVLLLEFIALSMVLPQLPTTIASLSNGSSQSVFRYTLATVLFIITFVLGSLFSGIRLDVLGRRIFLLSTVGSNVLGFVLLSIPSSFNQLLIARVLNGFGQVSANIIQANLSDLTPSKLRPQIFGIMNAVIGVAFILGSLLTSLFSSIPSPVPLVYVGALSLSLLGSLVAYWHCPETIPFKTSPSITTRERLLRVASRSYFKSYTMLFCFNICNYGLLLFWPLYTQYRFGWDSFQIGLSLALLALMYVLSQSVVLPWFLSRFTGSQLLRASTLSTGFSFIVLGLCSSGWLFALLPLCNLLGFASVPLIQGELSGDCSADDQGSLVTIFGLLSAFASLVSSAITGFLLLILTQGQVKSGWLVGTPFYVLSLILLISWLLCGSIRVRSTVQQP